MSEELQTEQGAAPNPEVRRGGVFTRRALSSLGKVAAWSFLVSLVLCLAVAVVLTIFSGAPSVDISIAIVLLLVALLLIVSGVRWLQVLAIPLALYILYRFFHEPFVVEALMDPKGANGGFGKFSGNMLNLGAIMLALVACVGVALQNYGAMGRKNPRWLTLAYSGVAGFVIGALCIGALSPSPVGTTFMASAPLQVPRMAAGPGVPTALNMGMADAPLSVPQLQDSASAAHVDRFTLTAQAAQLTLSSGVTVPAWTFNGTAPGPVLHVRQGDEVVVTLINHLPFGVTIHWHGVRVPNAADGVAGVTQDAVKPGQSYVYRFTALDAGTYWYHSHQFSYEETTNGLYGMLIVDAARPTLHVDVDEGVALHAWNGANNQTVYTMNATAGTLHRAVSAGQWVRLRIVNSAETQSGNPELVTLVGAPFQVIALDGHDLNGPQWLTNMPLAIGSAQRYDLYFQMPVRGAVALVTTADSPGYQRAPAMIIGQGVLPQRLPAVTTWFDLSTYGTGAADAITVGSHFDATYAITLGNQVGNSLGRMGMTYTMNGKVFPDTGMIMVKEGQLIRLHFDNQTGLYHPMHLHGHVFTVLEENGKVLTGSPVHVDTVLIPPHTTYDVAFAANNPGIWMLHCHNFLHANWGMDMMVMYNVSTPYTVGSESGNFPD